MAAASTVVLGSIAAAGLATQIYGNVSANKAQAQAEKENAQYLEHQAAVTREASRRAENNFEDEAAQFLGSQVSGYSRGGVALTGSPLAVLADTLSRQLQDKEAIKLNYAEKETEALLKAGASYKNAKRLSSWKSNVLPAAGATLQTGAQVASFSGNK